MLNSSCYREIVRLNVTKPVIVIHAGYADVSRNTNYHKEKCYTCTRCSRSAIINKDPREVIGKIDNTRIRTPSMKYSYDCPSK